MRTPSKTFRDLIVWQKAHEFTLFIYTTTKQFPSEEKFGLTSQLRRAAVSIAANIAEGFTRRTQKEKSRFFELSKGSLDECRYYLILSKNLDYYSDTTYDELYSLLQETSKLLNGYTKKF